VLTGGPGASATEGKSALTERAQRQGNWAPTGGPGVQGARARSSFPRSGSCDPDQTEEIRLGRGERLWAALLLSAAVRSPKLRQARARVAPGSPELGREGENATTNSMAGKRPRIRGQRGENGGENVSGGPEELQRGITA
jgi:hypothetical protein